MNLNIKCINMQDDVFSIKFNGTIKIVDSINQEVSFAFDSNQEYTIEIEQIIPKKMNVLLSILLFLVTCLIQGIFNILLMNTNSNWYNDINPYRIRASFKLALNDDTSIAVKYKKSSCNNNWSTPILSINDVQIADIELIPIDNDFKNKYSSYVKKLVSIFSVVLVILSFLLQVSVSARKQFVMIFITALISILIALVVGITIFEHKRMKKLHNSFLLKLVENDLAN